MELVHIDLCGPIGVKSVCGSSYFITSIDDYSRYITTYCIFKFFCYSAEMGQIKTLRSDNGKEFINSKFKQHFVKMFVHQTTVNNKIWQRLVPFQWFWERVQSLRIANFYLKAKNTNFVISYIQKDIACIILVPVKFLLPEMQYLKISLIFAMKINFFLYRTFSNKQQWCWGSIRRW